MTERHIMLIGMMGAGKSTVGTVLARRLERVLVDVDELIESTTGRSIPDIFASEGEEAFRGLERDALIDVCASPAPLVIAAGGGAMLDAESRRLASASATVVWLRAEPALLAERVASSAATGREADEPGTRPLLAPADPLVTLEHLAAVRSDSYAAAADVAVQTDDRSVEQVVDTIMQELTRCDA